MFTSSSRRLTRLEQWLRNVGAITVKSWLNGKIIVSFFEQFCQSWHEIHREKLASLVCPPTIVQQILANASAPLTPQDLEPSINWEEYDFAVNNGHFIRSRFVLRDLLYFLGA